MLEFPPDETALYQIILFVALWFVLKRLAFDRFLETLRARHAKTRGATDEAARLREEVARMRAEHDAFMASVRREGSRLKEEIRREAENEERQILEAARQQAGEMLESLRVRVASETAAARSALERETADITNRIVERVLGRRA